MIIDFDPDPSVEDAPFDAHLAEYMSDQELNILGSELVSDYEYSFIWLGAGNAFESCAPEYRLHYTGKVNGFRVFNNKVMDM